MGIRGNAHNTCHLFFCSSRRVYIYRAVPYAIANSGIGKILKHSFCAWYRILDTKRGRFRIVMAALGQKCWGLDRAWTAFGSSLDALGQPFGAVFTRLGQRLAASPTGLDSD